MSSIETYIKTIFKDKLLIRLISIICLLGLIVNCSKIYVGGLFAIMFVIPALIPYGIYSILGLLCKSKWIALLTGITIVILDLMIHIRIFCYPQDAQDAIAFIFTPFYLSVLCVILYIILFLPQILITKFILKR